MESLLKKQDALLDMLAVSLPELKTKFGLHGGTSSGTWEFVKYSSPAIAKNIESCEVYYGIKIDFDNLGSWLTQIREEAGRHKGYIQLLAEYDVDWAALNTRDLKSDGKHAIEKIISRLPEYKVASNVYGPNWLSHTDAIHRLSGFTRPSDNKQIPLSIIKKNINEAANEICDLWNTLKCLKREGRVGFFKAQWDKLQPEARDSWLQQFSELHPCPNLAIYKLAQDPNKRVDKEFFLTPLLNIEDLSQMTVLPDLLQARSTVHPKTFLSTDSCLVGLGYWHQALKNMQVKGRVSFFSDIEDGGSPYGIQFEPEPDALAKPYLINPIIGLHQLEAQKKTYSFFVSCLSAQMEPFIDLTAGHRTNKRYRDLSLLDQSALLQYRRPDCIDWQHLEDILKASADEAVEDLWQLRTDAEYWHMRFTDMQRNASTFLHSVFGRIDIFLTIYEKLQVCRNDIPTTLSDDLSTMRIPCDDAQITGAISMHTTLRLILNEMLSSMQTSSWLRRKFTNKTLRYLSDLLVKDDPTVRLMSFDAVLRTMERELSGVNDQDAPPFLIAQALHDMSLVAACAQETSKHHNLILNVDRKYAILAHDAISQWQERERPWMLPVQAFLKRIQRRGNEFNKEARNEKLSVEDRHCKFWNSIDACMSKWDSSNPIVRWILSQAPVPSASAPTSATTILEPKGPPQTGATPTRTQAKKSRRRKPQPNSSGPLLGMAVSSTPREPSNLPPIYVKDERDKEFWVRIRTQKGQERFESWTGFLTRVGFELIPSAGSGRSFEYESSEGGSHTIVFHEPHGSNGSKIPHGPARGLGPIGLRGISRSFCYRREPQVEEGYDTCLCSSAPRYPERRSHCWRKVDSVAEAATSVRSWSVLRRIFFWFVLQSLR